MGNKRSSYSKKYFFLRLFHERVPRGLRKREGNSTRTQIRELNTKRITEMHDLGDLQQQSTFKFLLKFTIKIILGGRDKVGTKQDPKSRKIRKLYQIMKYHIKLINKRLPVMSHLLRSLSSLRNPMK